MGALIVQAGSQEAKTTKERDRALAEHHAIRQQA
jgi:hypothetical protein